MGFWFTFWLMFPQSSCSSHLLHSLTCVNCLSCYPFTYQFPLYLSFLVSHSHCQILTIISACLSLLVLVLLFVHVWLCSVLAALFVYIFPRLPLFTAVNCDRKKKQGFGYNPWNHTNTQPHPPSGMVVNCRATCSLDAELRMLNDDGTQKHKLGFTLWSPAKVTNFLLQIILVIHVICQKEK